MNSACVFCIDDAYVMPFQVFFHSLDATCSIPTATPLFILHTAALSKTSIATLQAFLGRYGRTASFVDATALIPEDLPIRPSDHVSPATFYRLFIAQILPAEIEQAIYLDADMLALRSIASLFDEPVHSLVAAADHCSPDNEIRMWGDLGGTYFQAGVLVIPLRAWRERDMHKLFLKVMADEQERIRWWDQDILNIALKDRWKRLPIWYNVSGYVNKAAPLPLIKERAALIHFDGSRKPWNTFSSSPFCDHWDQAYEAVFGLSFDRSSLRPKLLSRLKSALRLLGQSAGILQRSTLI